MYLDSRYFLYNFLKECQLQDLQTIAGSMEFHSFGPYTRIWNFITSVRAYEMCSLFIYFEKFVHIFVEIFLFAY